MAKKRRLDQFKGSQNDYIFYLEGQLTEARHVLVQHKSTTSHPNLPKSRPYNSLFQPPDNAAAAQTNAPESHVAKVLQGHSTSQLQARHGLEIIQYGITGVKSCKEAAWQGELNGFLSSISMVDQWPEKRKELDLSCMRMNQFLIRELFIDFRNFELLADTLSPLCLSLFPDARKIKTPRSLAKTLVQFSQFTDLLFASVCKIALHLKFPITVVGEHLSKGLGCPNRKKLARHQKTIDRLLRGASWANRCISMLFDNGWKHRSTEAFLLFARPLELYARFSDYKTSNTLLRDHLIALNRIPPDETPGWIPYSIPSIIKILFGDALTLSQICTCLGYSKEYLKASVDLPSKYHSLLQEGSTSYNLRSKMRPQIIMDGDSVETDSNSLSGGQAPNENDQDADMPLMGSPLAKSPLLPTAFDMSSLMDQGFDISQLLEIEFDTAINKGILEQGL